ncbi:MAG TPA: hypothetical protein VK504_25535 [Vicinamibacterales bacterium]|nr:hypothetical protein [Vicinamibacterales bacterium]
MSDTRLTLSTHEIRVVCTVIMGELACSETHKERPRMKRDRWDDLHALLDRFRRAEYDSLGAQPPEPLHDPEGTAITEQDTES